MRLSRSVTSRTRLPILALMIAALAIGVGFGAAVNAHPASLLQHASTGGCVGSPDCWLPETVDFKSNGNNYVTAVNYLNSNTTGDIVGAYSTGNGVFQSFWASPAPSSTAYPGFTAEDDVSYASTFLQGLSNNGGRTSAYQVGYAGSGCGGCSTVGVLFYNNGWTIISDPNAGSCATPITQVLAINDTEQGIGFYSNQANGCNPQAFEFYHKDSSHFEYHDFSPPSPPPGGTYVSSIANAINTLGDVVGTETWKDTSKKQHTFAWYYSELNYYSFQNGTDDTTGNGVNFNDGVVGAYSDSSGTHGYFVGNPEGSSPRFVAIDISPHNPPYTVVNSINTNWTISGWYLGGSDKYDHGFVALCTTCPNTISALRGNTSHAGGTRSRFITGSPRRNNP